MKIKYFNTNFKTINNTTSYDIKIADIISNLPALKIISNEEELKKNQTIVQNFEKNKNKIILLGTGGSNLGARALYNIINKKKINIEFYDNIDPTTFENSFNNIDFEATGFLIISKSGNTPETLAQFSALYQIALEKNKLNQFLSNILIITETKNSALYSIAKENKCLMLEHNKEIGGRYSIFSNVGIVPAILCGININDLYLGAKEVINNFDKFSPLSLGKYLCTQQKKIFSSNVLMTYSDNLFYFGKWYLQLWAESIGKNNKGITAIHSIGTTDQHSQLQLYLDGPKDKFFEIHAVDYNESNDFIDITLINHKDAMIKTLESEKLPITKVTNYAVENIKEISLQIGNLFANSILEVLILAELGNIDPFGQDAVERQKNFLK